MRGRFITEIEVGITDDGRWRILSPLVYSSDEFGEIVVPRWYVTEFSSIPRLPLALRLCGNAAHAAKTVHDYLYSHGVVSRKAADRIFLDAMDASGVPSWRRYPMFFAVRLLGWMLYKGKKHVGPA